MPASRSGASLPSPPSMGQAVGNALADSCAVLYVLVWRGERAVEPMVSWVQNIQPQRLRTKVDDVAQHSLSLGVSFDHEKDPMTKELGKAQKLSIKKASK